MTPRGGPSARTAGEIARRFAPPDPIPGRAVVSNGADSSSYRRARVRVRVPEIDVDEPLPVIVWSR